jgi:hypothetical protein
MHKTLNILFDNNPYNSNDWEIVFNNITRLFNYEKLKFGKIDSLVDSDIYITLAPTYRILIAKFFGVKVIFVNWQYPLFVLSPYKLLKYLKLMFYIYLSNIILTNDPNQKTIFFKKCEFLRKPVNLELFCSSAPESKIYDIVIPGDAERDLSVIEDLIKMDDLRIARISRNIEGNRFSNVDFFHNLSLCNYKKLIMSSKIGVLPLKSSNHLAGQSVLLELIACNVPVYISMGYTYMAFKNYSNVFLLDEKSIRESLNKFNSYKSIFSRELINNHSIHNVSVRLNEIILKCLRIK